MRRTVNLVATLLLVLVFFGFTVSSVLAVIPTILLSRTSGPPGTSVGINGSGFTANEAGVTVLFDGNTAVSGLTADANGAWTATFVIPPSASGNHTFNAYGNVIQTANVSAVSFYVTPVITIAPASGPPGTSVTVTGAGFGNSETGITVTLDGNPVTLSPAAPTVSAQGVWTASFIMPLSAAGNRVIDAYGSSSSNAAVPDVNFSISPAISIKPNSGPPAASVTVTGTGFAAGETGITVTYDGTAVTLVPPTVAVNAQGTWTASFTVPSSAAGNHVVDAYGAISAAGNVPDMAFSVTPVISVGRTSGAVGSSVPISGAGFGPNEGGITVTCDGAAIASGITANAQGTWTSSFVVPALAAGNHVLDASGAISQAANVPDISFSITAAITMSRTSGAAGTSVTVTGAGFGAGETGIVVTYDDAPVASGITANPEGSWKTTFVVPPSTSGSHTVSASGSITKSVSVGGVSLSVTAAISVDPPSGYIGEIVTVSGSGFAANSPLRFSYDNSEIIIEGSTTGASGSFSQMLKIPKSRAGAHTVTATDGERNQAKVTFTVENTPPPVPRLLSPVDGSTVGIVGGGVATFKWSAVTDPSGVSYVLQVDSGPDFTQPLLNITDIVRPSYTLTHAEALDEGQYYWRVKAIDGASNESEWSPVWSFKSGLLSMGVFILLIILALAVVGVALYLFLMRPLARRREATAVAEAEAQQASAPQVVLGQWREVEPVEQPRARIAAPRRKALPQPVKRLTADEQARLKVVADFAQSLPLVESGYDTEWVINLVRATGTDISPQTYEQLLKGDISIHYEPAWTRHPLYQELKSLLEGQPILQELNGFVDTAGRCASEAVLLLQDINRDVGTEAPPDFMAKGGWGFISAVYTDALSWYRGKSLMEPSERDYSIKPGDPDAETGTFWLHGEANTAFPGSLIECADEKEAAQLRTIHLKLRRAYRNNDRAKQLVAMMCQLEVQRGRLLTVFSQFGNIMGNP